MGQFQPSGSFSVKIGHLNGGGMFSVDSILVVCDCSKDVCGNNDFIDKLREVGVER